MVSHILAPCNGGKEDSDASSLVTVLHGLDDDDGLFLATIVSIASSIRQYTVSIVELWSSRMGTTSRSIMVAEVL
jgi:hypothetical protein